MARRKTTEQNVRKITKLGGHSLAVTIPIEMVRKLKWRERQKVVVKLRGKKLTVEDWPVRQAQGKPASPKRSKGGEK